MKKRNIYLKTVPVSEAVALAMESLDRDRLVRAETVPSYQACGRVTAAPVYAECSSPTFHSAAMDGYAVRAESTFTAARGGPCAWPRGRSARP
jgi:putative molybdopterin biosynthesis protein